MAITYLDKSGKSRQVITTDWNHGMNHYGRYGAWTYFTLDPMTMEVKVTDETRYAGDGMDYHWHIKWS